MIGATPRQMELLRFIHGYQLAHGGIAPCIREIAEAIGGGKGQIHATLVQLEERGRIRRIAGKPRAIEVLTPPAIPMIGGAPLYAVPLPAPER